MITIQYDRREKITDRKDTTNDVGIKFIKLQISNNKSFCLNNEILYC